MISFDLESILTLKASDIPDGLERDIQQVKNNIIKPWQTVLFSLYPFVPNLWESLDSIGKKEFLEKYYSYWMIYLAAFPVENADKILQLLKEDRLEMIGNLKSVRYEENTFKVLTEDSTIYGRYIINATGQAHNITQTNSLILNNLLASGIISPHPLGGIDIKFKNLQIRGKYKYLPLFVIGDSTWGACMATADLYQITQNQIPPVINSLMKAEKELISYHTTSRYRITTSFAKDTTTEPRIDTLDEKRSVISAALLNTPRAACY